MMKKEGFGMFWRKRNARTGQFERWSKKLLGYTQKGGNCLTSESIEP